MDKLKNNRLLFLVTLSFLLLGFVNIHFALIGFLCMTAPIVLLVKTNRKAYCQGYCPRANMYQKLKYIKSNKKVRRMPKWMMGKKAKEIVFNYFLISLGIMVITTIMVLIGRVQPMLSVRLFIVIPLGPLPQIVTIESFPWLMHLSYRMYSMILSTTLLGLVLGLMYQPRSWCVICPITSVSDIYLNNKRNK